MADAEDSEVPIEVINVFTKAAVAVKNRDASLLKDLSDDTLNHAAMQQDDQSISIAVIVYALSKIIDRMQEKELSTQTAILDRIQNRMEKAKLLLDKGNQQQYKEVMKEIFAKINEIDVKFTEYVQEVIEKAKVKKASKMHERGISLGRTAELLGLTQWDLMNYVGKTMLYDREPVSKVSLKQRMAYAEELFGITNGKSNRL